MKQYANSPAAIDKRTLTNSFVNLSCLCSSHICTAVGVVTAYLISLLVLVSGKATHGLNVLASSKSI